MIIGKSDILKYFEKQGKKYYAVFKKGTEGAGIALDRNTNGEEEEVKNMDPQSALQDFKNCLTLLRQGDYTLLLNDNPKVSQRGALKADFRVELHESLATGSGVAGTSPTAGAAGLTLPELFAQAEERATQKFEKLMAEKEAKDLKDENERLKKELREANNRVDEPLNKLMGALAPYAPNIISGFLGPASPMITPGVAGVSSAQPTAVLDENATEEEVNAHATQVFERFVDALQQRRPDDFLQVIVRLTDVINNKPDMFEMALKML